MKESTRRRRRRQEHERQWAEIVALAAAGEGKTAIQRKVGCCRQTVHNVLARARGKPPGSAPVPARPGPAPGSGRRISLQQSELVLGYRAENPGKGYHYCRHDLLRQGHQVPAAATIGRVWRRAGLLVSRGPAQVRRDSRWVPPRPQEPGHVQIDVKYLPAGRYEYTCIDVYSRYVYARVYPRLNARQAKEFLLEALRALPFAIRTVQTDRGGEFKAEFAGLLDELRRERRLNSPHSPWQNGVVERFHRTVAEECWLELEDELENLSLGRLDQALQDYTRKHNQIRLHSSLGYRPPIELLATRSEPVYPAFHQKCPTNP